MRRFTVAELKEAITALNAIRLTVLSNHTPALSLSIHQLDDIKKGLDPNTGGIRYTLARSGQLFFGLNHKSEETLATGDIFFNQQGKVTGLSNYTTNINHLFLVVLVLQKHQIKCVPDLQFLQDDPPDTLVVSESELSHIFSGLSSDRTEDLIAANKLTLSNAPDSEEDELFEEICFLENYYTHMSNKWNQGSSASPNGLFSERRHNNTPVKPQLQEDEITTPIDLLPGQ
ncbi:MAG: hypothetical protein P1U61_06680 [Legionellaceae bacterium]|nr:hypothetical protein [Legionellaceae bacterium]